MIHVIATVEVSEGKRPAFLEEFAKVVPLVRAEDGCIEYGATVDIDSQIPVQSPLRENVVVIVEKWRDLDSLRAHLKAPHMAEYRQRVTGLVNWVRLQVLEPV